jgi:hypothetical protein
MLCFFLHRTPALIKVKEHRQLFSAISVSSRRQIPLRQLFHTDLNLSGLQTKGKNGRKKNFELVRIFSWTPKRILKWKPIGTRTRGRPRKRWIAGIEEDLQIMGVRWWRKQCEKRAEWKKITEKAKTHSEL